MSQLSYRLSLAAVLLSCQMASGQQHTHATAASNSPIHLPVLVDGSKTPEKIPDNLAYEHYFTALSVPQSPTAVDLDRQAAQLKALQLSAADRQALVNSMVAFRTQLDQIANAALPANTADQVLALRTQKTTLVTTTVNNVRQMLSSDGANRLDQYIKTHVKARIVILGGTL
jgi:hypothetical protein